MSVDVTLAATLTVIETLAGNAPFALSANKRVTHNQLNQTETLGAATTPPATTVAAFNKALSTGTASIDFTSLTGTNGATVSASGLKLQAALIKATAGNANPITIADGASNGYGGWGADFCVALTAGQWVLLFGDDSTTDVDGTHKVWDLTGTGSQSADFILVFG